VAAKSDVHHELEKMLYFTLNSITDAGAIILSEYDTKSDTLRPKLIKAALMTVLYGDIKESAHQAGVEAVSTKFKPFKGGTLAEGPGEGEGDEVATEGRAAVEAVEAMA